MRFYIYHFECQSSSGMSIKTTTTNENLRAFPQITGYKNVVKTKTTTNLTLNQPIQFNYAKRQFVPIKMYVPGPSINISLFQRI